MTPRWARRKRVQEVKGARDRNMGRPATVHTTISMDASRFDEALKRHAYYAVPPSTWPEYPFLGELMKELDEERERARHEREAVERAATDALAESANVHTIRLNSDPRVPLPATTVLVGRNDIHMRRIQEAATRMLDRMNMARHGALEHVHITGQQPETEPS